MDEKVFPWKRFWCPRDGAYRLVDGYLVDPEGEHGLLWQPDVVPFDQISDTPCLVLLGEPGIGKSHAMVTERAAIARRLKDTCNRHLWFDLKQYGQETRLLADVFECEEFRDWLAGSHTLDLFLDSLDECHLHIPTLAAILSDRLSRCKEHTSRLHLRIACRTADWPAALEDGLRDLWPKEAVGIYELAPLRRSDVIAAAQTRRIDAQAFLDEVARLEAEPLAIKPVTLILLLNLYGRDKRLPRTKTELYCQGCRLLCTETSRSRQAARATGVLSADLRMVIAERIAAVSVFCNRSAIYTGVDLGQMTAEDVPIEAMQGRDEQAAGESFSLGIAEIEETLNTALFSGRRGSRLGFAHQTYAEFLAARYLVDHKLDLTQMMSLIRHSEDPEGRIIPQLAETAAWLASMDQDVFQEIIGSDPQVLLRSDVAKADNQGRAALVGSFLKLLDEERITDAGWDLHTHYSKLRHPQLASQLKPYILDRGKAVMVRRVAVDIAAACELSELQNLLVEVALNGEEEYEVRVRAADVVAAIGDDKVIRRLRPLIELAWAEDPEDDLKGAALRALWPKAITAAEVFALLAAPKSLEYSGFYKLFLGWWFPEDLSAEDLPVALEWVTNQQHIHHLPSSFDRLTNGILLLAWRHARKPEVLGPLAKTVLALVSCHRRIYPTLLRGFRDRQIVPPDGRRRAAVAAVVPLIPKDQEQLFWFWCHRTHLVTPDDLPWLIERLQEEGAEIQAWVWLRLIRLVFNLQAKGHLDAITRATKASPALAAEFSWLLEAVELNSPAASKMKRNYEEAQKWARDEDEQPQLEPPPHARIARCLELFEAGQVDAWWWLNREMTLEDTSTHYGYGPESDLTELPGWANADDETKHRIIRAAERYLQERDPVTGEWLGQNKIHPPDFSGYRALCLLQRQAPERLVRLSVGVWQKWAPVVIGFPSQLGRDEAEQHRKLVRLAYQNAPTELITALLVLIDHENSEDDRLSILHKIELCWDTRLCVVLSEKAKDESLKPSCMGGLLAELIGHGSSEAKLYAGSLIPLPLPSDDAQRARATEAALALLTRAEDAGWSSVWPAIESDDQFGRDVLLTVADHHEQTHTGELAQRLTEDQVADLYIWLSRQFPKSDGPRECVGMFRDGVLRVLQDRGTPAACQAIDHIRKELPHLDWLKWVALSARQTTLRQTWTPPTPSQLLELTRQPGSRLVKSGSQLLDVLVESLHRLEGELQGETPGAEDLWNEVQAGTYRPKDENHLTNYTKRHLERDLRRSGIVALREVEVRRGVGEGKRRARGQVTDIHVTAVIHGPSPGSFDRVQAIIEVKGCWNRGLKKDMQRQLVDRYLKDNQCAHGLYLVGWYQCQLWDETDGRRQGCPRGWSLQRARQEFDG